MVENYCKIHLHGLGIRKFYDEQIAKIGQAYAITFYIKIKNIKEYYLNRIMEIMLEKIMLLSNSDV